MYLFVDETENSDFFIVAGLLVETKEELINAYNHFKKKVKNMPITPRERSILFTEFKATILDRSYKRIKKLLLEELCFIKPKIYYYLYKKPKDSFIQSEKEKKYILMLTKIVTRINKKMNIVFDTFNKKDFENQIKMILSQHSNVEAIYSSDSQMEEGLQFIDNVCSVIRLKNSKNDKYGFYNIIDNFIQSID